jgi:predicted nuclease with TOPRIM domain
MSGTNPKLVILAAAMLAVTLILKVIPTVASSYSQLKSDRQRLQQDVSFYQELIEEETELQSRVEEARELLMGIEESVFQIPENLFGSEVQAIVRNIADRNGIAIREMRVAEVETFEDWFKVSQELSFEINQGRMLPFLNAVRLSNPRLYVRELTISRSRNQFVGSLTIEAFSRPNSSFE